MLFEAVDVCRTGLRLFEPLHAALWGFRKIIFVFYFYC